MTDPSVRKAGHKQKTYGKNIKSHVSSWFGRNLWAEIEPEAHEEYDEGRKKDGKNDKKKKRGEEERKRWSVEDEREEEQQAAQQLKSEMGAQEWKEKKVVVETPNSEEQRENLRGVHRGSVENVLVQELENLDLTARDLTAGDKKTVRKPSIKSIQSLSLPAKPSTDSLRPPVSPTKSIIESSDKENDIPPSPPHSKAGSGSRRTSRRRSPGAPTPNRSKENSPREVLKERPTPSFEIVITPSRRNALRKKADRLSAVSIVSVLAAASVRDEGEDEKEEVVVVGEEEKKEKEKEKEEGKTVIEEEKRDEEGAREDIKVWEDAEDITEPEKENEKKIEKGVKKEDDLTAEISKLEALTITSLTLFDSELSYESSSESDENDPENHPPSPPSTLRHEIPEISISPTEHEAPADNTTTLHSSIPIGSLLKLCTIRTTIPFADHINTLLKSHTLEKLGEASFSEVFLQSTPGEDRTVVLKIIPFGEEFQCQIESITQEVKITKAMAEVEGFIGFKGAYVVQGAFPQELMTLWDTYDEEKGSENERPDFYDDTQLFAIIALENGGTALEHFELKSWNEARELFWQVADALARGERERLFEHRDLHYGNIVIRRSFAGLKASIIDYTLSRAYCGPPTVFTEDDPFPSDSLIELGPLDDPALFTGQGDYQFEIYRLMRSHLSSGLVDPEEEDIDWNVFAPRTNIFWLHYVVDVLLRRKGLAKPATRGRFAASEEELRCWEELGRVARRIDPKRRRRKGEVGVEVGSASELVEVAQEEGWRARI